MIGAISFYVCMFVAIMAIAVTIRGIADTKRRKRTAENFEKQNGGDYGNV
jgi:hypothetical protein